MIGINYEQCFVSRDTIVFYQFLIEAYVLEIIIIILH